MMKRLTVKIADDQGKHVQLVTETREIGDPWVEQEAVAEWRQGKMSTDQFQARKYAADDIIDMLKRAPYFVTRRVLEEFQDK